MKARLDSLKPATQKSTGWVLQGSLLPAFGSLPLDRIATAAVHRWFDEYSRTAPGEANCALSVLRRILNQAVACGHLDTNPARGIRRNPRTKLTRFLSRDEVRRLHRKLDRHAGARRSRAGAGSTDDGAGGNGADGTASALAGTLAGGVRGGMAGEAAAYHRATARKPSACVGSALSLTCSRRVASTPNSSPSAPRCVSTSRQPWLRSRALSERPTPSSGIDVNRSAKAEKP